LQAKLDAEQAKADEIANKQKSLDELTSMTNKMQIGKKVTKKEDVEMREVPKITV